MNTIARKLSEVFELYPDENAIWVRSELYTYKDLAKFSALICDALESLNVHGAVLIYGEKIIASYAGIISSIFHSTPYVPLNPEFPIDKNKRIITLSGAQCVICSLASLEAVKKTIEGTALHIIALDIVGSKIDIVVIPSDIKSVAQATSPFAYIMFTSGTTGLPKGIPITHDNLDAYLRNIEPIVDSNKNSKFIHLFDFSFDLSVHDMFVCWYSGACLYVVPSELKSLPDSFIKKHNITHWFSVPSVGHYLRMFNRLTPNAFPSLTNVLFCGELLSFDLAKLWFNATPNAKIFNLYGPTEATIAFSYFEINKSFIDTWDRASVTIGFPLGDQNMYLDDCNTESELILSGSQIALGYLNDPQKTSLAFIADNESRAYRTGDIAELHEDYGYICLGRSDRQVKIRGYRVELDEIESVIETEYRDVMAAVTCNQQDESLVLYVQGTSVTKKQISDICKQKLPSYMNPDRIIFVDLIPLNSNSKKDYRALGEIKSFQVAG